MITLVHKFIFVLSAPVSLTLAAVPLKCLLGEYDFFDVFSKVKIPATFHDINKIDPQLDPMKLGVVIAESKYLRIEVKDLEYTGFSNAVIDEFRFNSKTNLSKILFHTDYILSKGLYKFAGSLFSKPISGEGSYEARYDNVQIEMVLPYDIITDEAGRRYLDVKTFFYWYDISDSGEIEFTGLYNGNKERSEAVQTMIKQNFRVFVQQFGRPFLDRIVGHIFNVFRNYVLSYPLRDYSTC